MKDKLNSIPMPVVILAAVAVLGIAGFFMFRTAQNQNGSYTVPMDRTRYMERMKAQAGSAEYSPTGKPGQAPNAQRGPRGRMPGAGSAQAGEGGAGSYGGQGSYGRMAPGGR